MILIRHESGIRRTFGVLGWVALAVLAVGCSSEPAAVGNLADPEPCRGGSAVLGSISDVDSWNEYTSQQSFAGNVLRRIYLRLAQDNGQGIENPTAPAALVWCPSIVPITIVPARRNPRSCGE